MKRAAAAEDATMTPKKVKPAQKKCNASRNENLDSARLRRRVCEVRARHRCKRGGRMERVRMEVKLA